MSDPKILYRSDRNCSDGRSLCVTAERGYGDSIILRVADDFGDVSLYFPDVSEVSWLGNSLIEAWAAVTKE